MKNSLGNPARGEAFYPRKNEIKNIYKAIDTGASIYLSAPRRVGKTSILKNLEDNPENGCYFIYIITESVYEENKFFETIFEELFKSNPIKTITKFSQGAKNIFDSLLDRVQSVQGVELRQGKDPDYYQLLINLLSNISEDYEKLIIMIDEFPQTIQNILEKSDKNEAQRFIQKNRELRHQKNILGKVSFIYTGSVSLIPLVDNITSLTAVNDLRIIEVHPLSKEEGCDFLAKLMSNEKIILSDEIIKYTMEKIKWLIPFHIQLMQQEIIDVYETTGKEIDKTTVDKAFDQIIQTRNKPQFEPYFSRLSKIFKGNEYYFVLDLLKFTAINDIISKTNIYDFAVRHSIKNPKYILDILIGDGYIFPNKQVYCYTSPILQFWCKKHICE